MKPEAVALAARRCRPASGAPMDRAAIDAHLAQLDGWSLIEGAIEKRYDFADYRGTLAFVNAVAAVAEAEDHHPDLLVSWGRCTVRWNTHSVGGISINDFICAAKVDALPPP